MAIQNLRYVSDVFIPTKGCTEVTLCLTDDWAGRTVNGTPLVVAEIQNAGRFLGSRGMPRVPEFENPRCNDKYQYSLAIDDSQFLEETPGNPYVLDCADILEISPYACTNDALLDAANAGGGGGGFTSFTVNAGTTSDPTDNSLGEEVITDGQTVHFWSPTADIAVNTTPGSAVVGVNIDPTLRTSIDDAISQTAINTGDIAQNASDIAAIVVPTVLDDLSDVSVPGPANGEVLTFTGASWEAVAPSGGVGPFTPARLSVTNSGTGALEASTAWSHDPSGNGHIVPLADNTVDLGTTADRPRTLYASTSVVTPAINNAGDVNDLVISTSNINSAIVLESLGGNGVEVDNGDLLPKTDNVERLGLNGQAWQEIHGYTIVAQTEVTANRIQPSGTDDLFILQSGNINSSIFLGPGAGATIEVTAFDGYLWPVNDDAIDLGAALRRWRDIYTNGPVTTFTGAHIFEVDQDTNTPGEGDAVILVGGKLQQSTQADDKRIAGILMNKNFTLESGESFTDPFGTVHTEQGKVFALVAAVGDSNASGLLNAKVCDEGGAIEYGDLLSTASKAGFLKKKANDVVDNTTLGKAMEDASFDVNGEARAYIYFK